MDDHARKNAIDQQWKVYALSAHKKKHRGSRWCTGQSQFACDSTVSKQNLLRPIGPKTTAGKWINWQ